MIPSTLFDSHLNVLDNKPYSMGCLDPIALPNGDGTYKFVPCRHCVACRLKQMFRLSASSVYEIYSSKAVAFVTLTYRNSDIPKAFYHYDSARNIIVFTDSDGVILSEERFSKNFLNHLNKISRNYADRFPCYFRLGQVPYICKQDVTKYLKRIRVASFRQGFNPKVFPIRYLLCAEYGESFARPHFHLLLYFQSETQYTCFKKIASEKWYFGNCYLRRFHGYGASYLSSYTVGSSANSYFYGRSFARQFVRHSNHLGFKSFETFSQISKKYSPLSLSYKFDTCYTEFGSISVAMPYNYKASLFVKPRCSKFLNDWFFEQHFCSAVEGYSSPFERLKLTFLKLLPFNGSVSEITKYIIENKDCIYYDIFGHSSKDLLYKFAYNRIYYDCRNSFIFIKFANRFYSGNLMRAYCAYISYYNTSNFINFANNKSLYDVLSDFDCKDAAYLYTNKPKTFVDALWRSTSSFDRWSNYCNSMALKYSKAKKQKHLYTLKDYE